MAAVNPQKLYTLAPAGGTRTFTIAKSDFAAGVFGIHIYWINVVNTTVTTQSPMLVTIESPSSTIIFNGGSSGASTCFLPLALRVAFATTVPTPTILVKVTPTTGADTIGGTVAVSPI